MNKPELNYKIYNPDSRHRSTKRQSWDIAKGLQSVDYLNTSEYLDELIKQNIDGSMPQYVLKDKLTQYYEIKENRNKDTKDADIISANINDVLSQNAFVFSPQALLNIHYTLFRDTYKFAGKIRDKNIEKKEWVLDGDSVTYAPHQDIRETLKYDFDQEKNNTYVGINQIQFIKRLSRFIANIWQIHPFFEGNTRTTAVFLIKYLRKLGIDITNDVFKEYSLYFRNALVRANYSNIKKNIDEDIMPLQNFLNTLIFNKNTDKNFNTIDFHNRDLHV